MKTIIQRFLCMWCTVALESYTPDNQQKITEMTKKLEQTGYLLGRTIHEGDTPHQLAFYHPRHNDLIFDVAFYYNTGDNQRYVCNHDLGNLVLYKPHFEELTTFMDLPCPKDIEGHITYRYGANWKTPIKGAHHTWLSGIGVLR